jgi:Phage capsid protein
MGLLTEVWANDIASNIFKKNSFVRRSKNDDAYVVNHSVNLPQSGVVPVVVMDRATVPAVATERVDANLKYDLHEFSTNPIVIRKVDEVETSYEKRQDVLQDHTLKLDDDASDYVAYAWTPSTLSQIVKTSGTVNRTAIATGATGTRKMITKKDILEAKRILDRMNVPQDGRVLLLNSEMYNDLLTDPDILTALNMNRGLLPEGVIGRLYGFDVMMRSSATTFTTGFAAKPPASVAAATDNAGSLAYHPMFVRAALGGVEVMAREDDPLYYGSVLSAILRASGSPSYTDFRGVVGISEQP